MLARKFEPKARQYLGKARQARQILARLARFM
jgi:hypothetical protein